MSKQQPNKQPSAAEKITEAERLLDALKAERKRLAAKAAELGEATAKLAYGTHALRDPDSGKELSAVRADMQHVEHAMREHDYAIAEAEQLLAQAPEAQAREADKAQARELRKAVERFVGIGRDLDRIFVHLAERGAALQEALAEVHRCGSSFPTHQQLDVLGMICVRTALQDTPWQRAVERTAPHEHRSFRQLVEGWAAGIEQNNIRPRLSEQTNNEAA